MIATNKDEEESILFKKKFVEKLGFFPEILSAKQTIKIEPHLNSNLKCSLFFKKNNQINAHLLKRYLIKDVKKMGADFLFFDQINKYHFHHKKFVLITKKISSEKIIVACGVWSNELLKKSFKVLFPMRPLKGVSMLFKTKKGYLLTIFGIGIFTLPLEIIIFWLLVLPRTKRVLNHL